MKKIFLIPACALFLTSCGGSKEGHAETTNDSIAKTEVEVIVPSNIIDPMAFDFSKPISTNQLSESLNSYFGKEIQMVIYPIPYFDPEKFSQDQSATGVPDSKEKMMSINFKTVPDVQYTKNTPFVIKCKIKEISVWKAEKYIVITDAELVGEAKDVKTESFNPANIKSTVVYSAKDVIANMYAWHGKQVTLTGNFAGLTTSSDKGKILEIRADITDASGSVQVGCAFDKDPAIQAGATNVKISGAVSPDMHYGNPYMTGCKVVQ